MMGLNSCNVLSHSRGVYPERQLTVPIDPFRPPIPDFGTARLPEVGNGGSNADVITYASRLCLSCFSLCLPSRLTGHSLLSVREHRPPLESWGHSKSVGIMGKNKYRIRV